MPTQVSHQATIIKTLTKHAEDFTSKIKGNKDNFFARYFFWTVIEKYAKAQKEASLDKLIEEEFIEKNYRANPEGEYTIGECTNFFISDKVSAPRKEFDIDILAEKLKKYKVPKPILVEMYNDSKVPGSSSHTLKIVER